MSGQERQESQLGCGQRRDAEHLASDRLELAAQLSGLVRQVAELGAMLVDVEDLPQRGVRSSEIAEGDVGAGKFEQRLDRQDGKRVGEQRSKSSCASSEVTALLQVSAVGRNVSGRRVDEGARPALPQDSSQITAAAKSSFLDGANWAYAAGLVAVIAGAALVFFMFPKKHDEQALLAGYHKADTTVGEARS